MDPPAAIKCFRCTYCEKTFGRIEHLRRHELIHTKRQQFHCSFCAKEFTRRDALQRHEQIHQVTSPSLLSKGVRACTACAHAKVRCSGATPCQRCDQKHLQCAYPNGGSYQDAAAASLRANSVVSNATPQPPLFDPLAAQMPMTYTNSPLDAESWDPNILNASNWLDLQLDLYDNDLAFLPNLSTVWAPQELEQSDLQPAGSHTEAYAPSPAAGASQSGISEAADVCAAQEVTEERQGDFYVDGDPARLPRVKRRKLSTTTLTSRPLLSQHAPIPSQVPAVLSLQSPLTDGVELKHRIAISADTYGRILEAWHNLCLAHSGPWRLFEASELPSKEVFEHLLGVYFAAFQLTLPFIHPATFDAGKADWMLILAMISIGARYLDEEHANPATIVVFANSLQEFLWRCIRYRTELQDVQPIDTLALAQCRILNFIGMAYSGDSRHHHHALAMQQILALAHEQVVISWSTATAMNSGNTEYNWFAWAHSEMVCRTAYSLFIVDSMIAYHFQRRPMLSLPDCRLALPCNEETWRARTPSEWQALSTERATTTSLPEALKELYIDKRNPRERGEFARIVLIHGLFHRTWDVARYYGDPLSRWEPTAKRQSSAQVVSSDTIWPPSVPQYQKWLHSVCDALDILHWQANATIGQASGLEHSTVAWLHLSRVVLLSPIDSIVRLAKALVGQEQLPADVMARDKQFIQRWAIQGQYKARLAAIHAGVTFWHIRRYAVDGFYEPSAVGLATLMLWAFGTFSMKQSGDSRSHGRTQSTGADSTSSTSAQSGAPQEEGNDDGACGIILLDRPTDDELVQQFIRKGHTMRANFAGVGDLYGPQGPERVLLEGCNLLESLKCWGVNAVWIDLLQRLVQTIKR